MTFDLSNRNEMTIHESSIEPWKITLVDTGKETMTGGRLKRVHPYLGNKTFMLTYGDGSWNNSGFFVMEPQLLDYIEGDHTNLEMDCMQKIANDGQLMAYKHEGFFQPMDCSKAQRRLGWKPRWTLD